jgi:predicted dehydrogenase
MQEIRFAIVGCGRIAERHIDAIFTTPNTKLVAVCDLNEVRAKEKAALAAAPYYVNYRDMLEKHPDIDVVIILTPSGMHYEHVCEILQYYGKHILIEKPMVLTVEQGAQLSEIAAKLHLYIFPVYQNRFNRAVQRVKTAITTSNELGKVQVGTVRVRWCRPQRYYDMSPWRGTWSMDGGALTNQGIHYIDLLRYLCGDVKRVHAKLSTLGASIEVEDTGVAILEFESGALGVIEIMTSARPDDFEASVSCVCDKGLAVISGIATNELTTFSPDPTETSVHSEIFKTVYGNGHNQIIQGVTDCLLNNKPPAIEFNDGLKTIQLLHAIYASDECDGWVTVDGAKSIRLGSPNDTIAKLYRLPQREKSFA